MCGLLENTPLDPTQLDYVKTAQASGSKNSTKSSLHVVSVGFGCSEPLLVQMLPRT